MFADSGPSQPTAQPAAAPWNAQPAAQPATAPAAGANLFDFLDNLAPAQPVQ